jgi:transcriptional regulator with XRE-family HTH domain
MTPGKTEEKRVKLAERGFAIGSRLREFRRAQALTQEELAEMSGVHSVTISNLEREPETRRASARNVKRLAQALGVPIQELTDVGGRPDLPGGAETEEHLDALLDFEDEQRTRRDAEGENHEPGGERT